MPLEWIDYKEAARLYHQEQVAYTCGSPLFKLYGGVSALSGYCNARSGDVYIFSILMNSGSLTGAHSIQDRMANAMAAATD